MKKPISIDELKDDLINVIQAKSKSQVESWRQPRIEGQLADGLSGYSDVYGTMHRHNLFRLPIFDRNGYYTISIDLTTGEIVNYDGKPLSNYSRKYILMLNDCDIDAEGYIHRLREFISKYDITEKLANSPWGEKKPYGN